MTTKVHVTRLKNPISANILMLQLSMIFFITTIFLIYSSISFGASSNHSLDTQVAKTKAPVAPVGNVNWNLPYGEPSSLDPIKSYYDSNNTVLANVCEGLLREKPDLSLAPGLATSYTHPSPTTWIYTLRSGVKFSNGHPLTSEDVVYSLRRNLNPKLGSYWAQPFYNNVKSIEAIAPNKVKISLSESDALFNRMLSTAAGSISEKSYVEKEKSKYGTSSGGLMCTGPYKLKEWVPGSKIVLDKNPYYWDSSQYVYANKITFHFITNPSTMLSALLAGQIDGMYEVPPLLIEKLKHSSSGTMFLGPGTQYAEFRYTKKQGPTNDPKIRQALSLSLNREAIVKVAYHGAAEASLTPVQPGMWGYGGEQHSASQSRIGQPQVDLAKAKQLVKEAGSPKQTIIVAAESGRKASAIATQALVRAGKQIGLNIEMKTITSQMASRIWFDSAVREHYDMFWTEEYGAGVSDPAVALSELTPLSAYNYGPGPGEYNNSEATASLKKGLRKPEGKERAQLIGNAEVLLVKDNALLTIATLPSTAYVNNKITGMPVSLAFLYYPWAADIGSAQ